MMEQLLEKIKEVVEPVVDEFGVDLVDIELRGKPGAFRLSIFVDTIDGISIDDCAEISKRLSFSYALDGILGERYRLEVSSPGIDRPLKTEKDFKRKLGKELEVYYIGDESVAKIKGILKNVDEEGIELSVNNDPVFIRFEQIKKALQALPW